MNKNDLVMENMELRRVIKDLKDENDKLNLLVDIKEVQLSKVVKAKAIEEVVNSYFADENLGQAIDRVKSKLSQKGLLKIMQKEFYNPGQEQLAAEDQYKEMGL